MDQCPCWRLEISGGRAGCQALFDQLLEREFSNYRYFRIHRMNVDSYSLQHTDEYGASAKSFMAHLCGLCCAVEFGNDPDLIKALRSSLDGKPAVERPSVSPLRGAITVASLSGISDADAYVHAADRCARSVWEAYSPLHSLARAWLERARMPGLRQC